MTGRRRSFRLCTCHKVPVVITQEYHMATAPYLCSVTGRELPRFKTLFEGKQQLLNMDPVEKSSPVYEQEDRS